MATASVKVLINGNIQRVWEVVTFLENFEWCSNLSGIEKLSETQFVEYTAKGYAASFTVMAANRLFAGNLIWTTAICRDIGREFLRERATKPKLNSPKPCLQKR